MEIQQLHDRLNELNKAIVPILTESGFNKNNDLYDMDCSSDPNAFMLREELTDVLDHLDVVRSILTYINKRVIGEYTLRKNANGRYSCEALEFSCGNTIEFYDYDDGVEAYHWKISRIEHDGTDYYIVGSHKLQLDGLKIRVRG